MEKLALIELGIILVEALVIFLLYRSRGSINKQLAEQILQAKESYEKNRKLQEELAKELAAKATTQKETLVVKKETQKKTSAKNKKTAEELASEAGFKTVE